MVGAVACAVAGPELTPLATLPTNTVDPGFINVHLTTLSAEETEAIEWLRRKIERDLIDILVNRDVCNNDEGRELIQRTIQGAISESGALVAKFDVAILE